ncbi:YqzE family protein [Paenibacillus sp.]|uniref:YqzE family protein n=1 Tax=Paenibacillus sp. TaxID=58172 RepID=UPI002D326A30|nr:YqzE family protein [Paenibacillus sp.]HZG55545.1 YqzE family protein [Paenibacillus sp.]
MAKGEEIVKYVTQRVVQYIETPSDRRKAERERRKQSSEPWTVRWFGLIPMSLSMLLPRRKKAPSAGKPRQGQ